MKWIPQDAWKSGSVRPASRSERLQAYAVALAVVAVVVAVQYWARDVMHARIAPLFFVAIVVSSLYGGFGPGLVSVAGAVAAVNVLFTEPFGQLAVSDPDALVRNGVFVVCGVLVSLPCAALRTGRLMAVAQAEENARLRNLAEEAAAQAEEEAARAEEEGARAEDEAARAASAAVETERARLRLAGVLSSIADGFLSADRDGNIEYVNDHALAALGVTSAELVGRNLWAALPDFETSPFGRACRRAMDELAPVRIVERDARSGGWFQVSAYPSSDGVSVLFQNISSLREAQVAMRESEERLRLALAAGHFGVWDWSIPEDRITWSERVYVLHGVAPGAFGGRVDDFARIVHPDDRDRVGGEIRRAVAGGGDYTIEFRVVHPDGAIHWLATSGRVLVDADGRPLRMLGVTWDTTERRETETRLRQMQRMESVGRLAGGIAHEVNNQMSVVIGFSDLVLRHADLPAVAHDDVSQIRSAGQRAAAVTSQLLAFSRRQMLRPEVLDLNTVVTGFQRVLHRTLGDDCVLELALGAELGRVRADRGQLEQVLLNLALNAGDAMPRGGVLRIETADAEIDDADARRYPGVSVRRGDYVVLTVRDDGVGIAADVLPSIFEPFFTTKGVGRGSGLGLSTVYGIVKQSDGYVWVESEPGGGATFRIYLPRVAAVRDAEPVGAVTTVPRASGRVMVVEDEPAVRSMVVRTLDAEGYTVVEALNGHDALQVLAHDGEGVELVITDVAMPEMGGRELAVHLGSRHPLLPVLFMSGYPDREIVSRGLLEAGRPFLQKPFPPEMLTRMVREMLDARR